MKSYTDITQSKKLAEILPIESADMYWLNWHIDSTESKYEVFVVDKSDKYINFFNSYTVAVDNKEIIPCWSLSALLNILPHCIDDRYDLVLGKLSDDTGWYVCYDDIDHFTRFYVTQSDLIDACIEMIVWLKENEKL